MDQGESEVTLTASEGVGTVPQASAPHPQPGAAQVAEARPTAHAKMQKMLHSSPRAVVTKHH